MQLKIRLKRAGAKKHPSYRIVVMKVSSSREGKFNDVLGFYQPLSDKINVEKERAIEWLKKGAIPTPTVRQLFKRVGI